jgi:uncharacterized DUF497 family protein
LGETDEARRAAYRGLYAEALAEDLLTEIRNATNGGFALGGERFQREIAAMLGRRTWRGRIDQHGVDFADLAPFFDSDLLAREDVRDTYNECRFQSIGVIFGVALFVVWTPRGKAGDEPHLISARRAVGHEERAWSQRYRKGR